jgi:hypothetical protein
MTTKNAIVPSTPLPFKEDTPYPQLKELFFAMKDHSTDLETKLKHQKNLNKTKQREIKKLKDQLEIKDGVIKELKNPSKEEVEEEEESDDESEWWNIKKQKAIRKELIEKDEKIRELYERLIQIQDKSLRAIMMK